MKKVQLQVARSWVDTDEGIRTSSSTKVGRARDIRSHLERGQSEEKGEEVGKDKPRTDTPQALREVSRIELKVEFDTIVYWRDDSTVFCRLNLQEEPAPYNLLVWRRSKDDAPSEK